METYIGLIVGLFVWAAGVFYVVGASDGNDGVGALIVLGGAALATQQVVGMTLPIKGGEPIGSLLEWVFTAYGLFGIAAVVLGVIIGKSMGEDKRRGV